MAGFTNKFQFHINTPGVGRLIRHANKMSNVITMQLDGDELDAALWGFENYKKGK